MQLFLLNIVAFGRDVLYNIRMREAKRYQDVLSHLKAGRVYQWNELKNYSNSLGRDMKHLLKKGVPA